MNSIEIFLALFLLTAIAATFAQRFKLPVELILLFVSLGISQIPSLPIIELQPSIVFTLFLPPILFSAAYFTSWRDFRVNIRSISLLAIGLVIFTTCLVAILFKWLLPQMSWSIAFLLGAIVSPPDASAASAIAKKLGMPRRLVTLIEGESLINDATALIAYRFALTATLTGAFSLWDASIQFISMSIGGVLVGCSISYLSCWLITKLIDNKSQNMLSLALPFITYLLAEHIGVSGVIATVSAGLFFSKKLPTLVSAEMRQKGETLWEMFIFVINGLVFTLIGLQLPIVIKGLDNFSPAELTFYAVICSFSVIVLRFIWIFPAAYLSHWISRSVNQHDTMPHWSRLIILSWTGMRGIVSLAAALSIPKLLPLDELMPWRNLIIFLTYAVILTTLIIPILTLPKLLEIFNITADEQDKIELSKARLFTAQAVLASLESISNQAHGYPTLLLKQTRERYSHRIKNFQTNLIDIPYSELFGEEQAIRRLNKQIIHIEREALLEMRKHAKIHDEVFHILQRELDIEDVRLRTQRL